MTPDLVPLTADDPGVFDAALAMRNAARAVDIPGFMPVCPHRFHGDLVYSPSHVRQEHAVARLDGSVVGHLALTLPLRDNVDNAQLELAVHPEHRRRGIGRAMYGYARDRLRELGRKRVTARTVEPLAETAHPARGFATTIGAQAALEEHRYRLDLSGAADPDGAAARERAGLLAAARTAAAGYRLVTWRNRTPEEHIADAAYLATRVTSDAPRGEVDRQTEQFDIQRVRETEDGLAAKRNHTYLAGAVHQETGRMVGFTMLSRQHSVPEQCSQWTTIVAPDHRGRRLGLFLKLENLQHIQAHEPALRTVDTWTAATNQHMIRINRQLGFRPVDRWVVWQATV